MYKHSKPWREFPLESPYTYLRNGLVTPDMYLIHIYIYKIYITLTIALKLLSIHPVKSSAAFQGKTVSALNRTV